MQRSTAAVARAKFIYTETGSHGRSEIPAKNHVLRNTYGVYIGTYMYLYCSYRNGLTKIIRGINVCVLCRAQCASFRHTTRHVNERHDDNREQVKRHL